MATEHEQFWTSASFAFVGHTAAKGFPSLSYGKSKKLGKKVYAVDPSVDRIQGDTAYRDFESLPEKVEAAVLEVPRHETAAWVRKAADAGIRRVWIHMQRDTPDAIAVATERGLELHTGACAVMYLDKGLSVHAVHRLIAKVTRKY